MLYDSLFVVPRRSVDFVADVFVAVSVVVAPPARQLRTTVCKSLDRGGQIFDSRVLNRKFLLQDADFQFPHRSRMYHTIVGLPITK